MSPKLQSFWKGPFEVVEKIAEVLYRIRNCCSGKSQVVHFNRLKPYQERDVEQREVTDAVLAPGFRGAEPLSSFSDDEDNYVGLGGNGGATPTGNIREDASPTELDSESRQVSSQRVMSSVEKVVDAERMSRSHPEFLDPEKVVSPPVLRRSGRAWKPPTKLTYP